jgi:hypothetical protein
MEINVRLGSNGGGRQAKLSAGSTSKKAVQAIRQASHSSSFNMSKIGSGMSSALGTASGNVGSLVNVASKNPTLGMIFAGLQAINGMIQFGANVYGSISGEDMLTSNIKAQSKTVSSLGLNLVVGGIRNTIFTETRIRRQNDMKDYGRELYLNASEKNKLI